MKSSTPISLSILSISLFLFLSLPSPSLSARCHPYDKNVLLQIDKAMNSPGSSWNKDSDCCYWYGVGCDLTTNRVIELSIFRDPDLSFQIPAAIGDLTYLQNLLFHKLPKLTGSIPPSITKLTHLTMLRISWTNLSGPVPAFLSQLMNLTFLDLSFNNLSGSIPPSFSQFPNLGVIHLDRNKLTGSIPESFGKFTGSVPSLYLSHNQLTGPIPRSLGDLDFADIDFSRNKLSGDASFLFGKSKTLNSLDLSRNMFEFDLSNVVLPESLTWMDLNHNKIYGSLPNGLTGLELQYLNVSYNQLCGKIPIGGKLQSFDQTTYFHNRCLCGAPLPACK